MITPEEKQRIEAIRGLLVAHPHSWEQVRVRVENVAWLLDLVERQEAEIARLRTHQHSWTGGGDCSCGMSPHEILKVEANHA